MQNYKITWLDEKEFPVHQILQAKDIHQANKIAEQLSRNLSHDTSYIIKEISDMKQSKKPTSQEINEKEDNRVELEYMLDCLYNIFDDLGNIEVNRDGELKPIDLKSLIRDLKDLIGEEEPTKPKYTTIQLEFINKLAELQRAGSEATKIWSENLDEVNEIITNYPDTLLSFDELISEINSIRVKTL